MTKEKETEKEASKEESTKSESSAGTSSAKDIEENKAITFLSYIGILALVPLLAKKESKFAQFHAKQGIVLFVLWFILAWISGFIPVIGWFLVLPLVYIGGIVLVVIGIINVAKGEMKELPLIGELVRKFKI